ILMISDAAVVGRQADHTAEVNLAAIEIDADTVGSKLAARQSCDPRETILPDLHVENAPPVMLKRKADLRPRHGKSADDIQAGGIFAAATAQEFAAGRNARKQVLDDDAGALGKRSRALACEHAIIDHAPPAIGAHHSAR